MATTAVVGVISLVLFVIHVVAIATPGWMVVGKEGIGSAYIGLFQVCFGSKCVSYVNYIFADKEGNVNVSFSYIAFVGLHIVGAIILFANGVNSLRHFRSFPDGQARSIATKAAIMLSVASGCILAGVVWFYLDMKTDLDLIESSLSQELKFGYSFYLAVVTGASSLVVAITMCVVASQMAPPPVITTFITPPCPQTVVVHSTTTHQAGSTYPMTSPVGFAQNDPAYGYDQ
ncbi:uncharacterized protein LOC110456766 [Mizuhopecten yessoensis]|uniref:Uncharacterized protein n=1 Tax=Mizuhopecten yessoensis TaxID=6573 RepID=A0A210QA73_MIZYE|nr:uncharacterized protein LOC110456766 [Mizuhopecten yessoensis]OWF45634.1 hypothetical protein KP79_PYT05937 [Mizuhopecten yessoensis]